MKLLRVGTCLASLTVGVACSQTPNALTAPSAATAAASLAETSAADGSTLKVTAPATVSPANNQRAETRQPTLVWLNSTGIYNNVGVAYDIELSTPTAVVYSRTVGESPNYGSHQIDAQLNYDTVYSWRVRAHIGNPDTVGPWSAWTSFLSPTQPVAVAPTTPTTTGGTSSSGSCIGPFSAAGTRVSVKPNDSDVPRAVVAQYPSVLANSCQPEGGGRGTWEFMDRTVDALRQRDGRYGYNAKRGNMNDPSLDVISFYRGADANGFQGSSDVYIFDLIGGHCGSTPSLIWNDVTDVTFSSGTVGRTMYPRPGRSVTATSCSATK